MRAKLFQTYLTLCDPVDCSPAGFSVHFQGKPFNTIAIQDYAQSSNAEEAELKRFYEDLGEGNGTPLQYSCPENPMDGGAW